MKKLFFLFLVLIFDESFGNPRVRTQLGILEGFVHKNRDGTESHVFLGVRYARAPVGDLRFEKPAPYPEWSGIYEAKAFANACVPIHPNEWPKERFNEDCLFLNIIRPSKKPEDPQGYPILIFIHGGGYSTGNAEIYGYKSISENFAKHGILVVTIQYRLGPFGFFSTGDKVLPGNIGFWDQMYALFFLNQFLPNFGGNPQKTTLMGHSAGAASVHALSMSPHSIDLFQQSIQLSGSLYSEWAMNDVVVDNSLQLADSVGCDSSLGSVKIHDCLKTKSVDDILEGIEKMGIYKHHVRQFLFVPRFDGEFLSQNLEQLMRAAPDIPTVFGVTNAEMARVANKEFDLLKNPLGIKNEEKEAFDARQLQIYIADHVLEHDETGRAGGDLRMALYEYFVDRNAPETTDNLFYQKRAAEIVSDLMAVMPVIQQIQIENALNHKSYLFYQKYAHQEQNVVVSGCEHGDELKYIFDLDLGQSFEFNEKDRLFQKNLLEMIRNFTIHGEPKSSGIDWPDTRRSTRHVVLDPDISIENEFEPEKTNFWLKILPKRVGTDILKRTRLPHVELFKKHTEL